MVRSKSKVCNSLVVIRLKHISVFMGILCIVTIQAKAQQLNYFGPNSYNVSGGKLNDSFSITSEEERPQGMAFNNDGTRLYIVGRDVGINEYTLSVPYDVSTSSFVDDFSVSDEETIPTGMAFNDDGTKLYVIGRDNDNVNEYDLSVAFDVSTGTFVDATSVSGEETSPTGMAFNNDGSKLYVIGVDDDEINEYDLSVAYDVSTSSFVDNFDVSGEDTTPQAMAFNYDGTKLYVVGNQGDDINVYDLSVAYDVSTGIFVANFSVVGQDNVPTGIAFNNHGTKLYITGNQNDSVYEYDLALSDYVESSADDGSIDNSLPLVITLEGDTFQDSDTDNILDITAEVTIGNVPSGLTPVMTLSNNDQTVTLTFTGNATNHQQINSVTDLTFIFDDAAFVGNDASAITGSGEAGAYSTNVGIVFSGFNGLIYRGNNSYNASSAQYNTSFSVLAQETLPTGVAFNNDGSTVYVVGQISNAVNEYKLSTPYDISTGVFSAAFSVATQEPRPQGMAFNDDGTKLYVIGSDNDNINEYDLFTPFSVSTAIFVDDFSVASEEIFPTGMAFNIDGTKLYIIGDDDNEINEYDLSPAYDVSTATFVDNFSVGAEENRPQSMAFNYNGTRLYVMGFQGFDINEYHLSVAYDVSTGTFVDSFSVESEDSNPKGIAFKNDGAKLYMIGGENDAINEYTISPGDFTEAAANDGSINNSSLLVITIEGDTFQDSDTDNILDIGSEVTIGNVPVGLTPVMTLSNSDKTVTLTFTGNAANHLNINDIANMTFVFDDLAFVGNDASIMAGSGDAGAYSSNIGVDFSGFKQLNFLGFNSYNISSIQFKSSFSVSSQEPAPQGMAFNNDGSKVYVVGANSDAVSEYRLTTPYDISTSTFLDMLNIAAYEEVPRDLAFNNDGTKLYVIGTGSDMVHEYDLSAPYNVSTGTYVDNLSIGSDEMFPSGLAFNVDGSKLYTIGQNDDEIDEYDLSLAFDVSSATFVDSFSVSTEEDNPQDLAFNHDGTRLYVVGVNLIEIIEYHLTVAYDVSTGIFVKKISAPPLTSASTGMAFNNDGTKLYAVDGSSADIYEFDINPGSYAETTVDDGSIDNSSPLIITVEGDTFQDVDADDILDVGSEVTIGNVPAGLTPVMTLSNNDKTVTLTFTGNAINHQNVHSISDLALVFEDAAFVSNDASTITGTAAGGTHTSQIGMVFTGFQRLSYHGPNSYNISSAQFIESFTATNDGRPYSLAFNNAGTKYYVSSLFDKAISEYDVSTPYDISTSIFVGNLGMSSESLYGDMSFNNNGTKLFILESSAPEVLEFNLPVPYDVSFASFVDSFPVDRDELPFGMAFNNMGSKLYVAGNVLNGMSEYSLSTAYDASTGSYEDEFISTESQQFVSVEFNNDGNKLYAIGLPEGSIFEYDLSVAYDVSTGSYVDEFSLLSEDTSPTDITFNNDGTKLFVVGFASNTLNEYHIDVGDYNEAVTDDGSIDGASPLVITLEGDTFQDTDTDNVLDVGTEVTIGNVPAGLTPVMTLSNDDQTVTLTFTGSATDHLSFHSLSDLTFEFDDAAFVGNDASIITNSGDGDPYNSNVGILFIGELQRLSYHGPNSYNTSSAQFNQTFSISAQESSPQDIVFNSDGTKLFVVGNQGDDINEYLLSLPYDVSTISFVDAFSVADETTDPRGIVFNNDGTKLYAIAWDNDNIFEYDLSVPYDVSTSTLGDSFSVASEEIGPTDMAFNNDGTKLYVIGRNGVEINEYDLSVAFDVSTGSHVDNFSVATLETDPQDLAFNHNGTKLYIIGIDGDAIHEYDLSVAYDVSTGTLADSFSVESEDTDSRGLAFNNDGTKLYFIGKENDNIVEYDIDPGDYIEASADDGSIDNSSTLVITLEGEIFQDSDADDLLDISSEVIIGNIPVGLTPVMTLSNSDQTVTLSLTGNATNHQEPDDITDLTFEFNDAAFVGNDASLITNSGDGGAHSSAVDIAFFGIQRLSYHGPNGYHASSAKFNSTFSVATEEVTPQGMAFNNDGTKLYVIGNTGDDINEYDLSTSYDVSTGTFVDAFSVFNQESNPLGMAFNNDGTKLYVIGRLNDNVNEYDLSMPYDISTATFVDAFSVASEEAGPTGMAFNNDGTKLYIIGRNGVEINEYDLSVAYDVSTGTAVDFLSVAAEETDPHGMAFNHDGTKLYVTGVDAANINEYDLSVAFDVSTGTLVDSFKVPELDTSPTGIAFNNDGTKLYIVGNTDNDITEYDIEPGDYLEATANDGSIDNSRSLVITLEGDTFQDSDTDNTLDIGTEVTIGNVPTGLTPVITLSNSDQTATLTFSGNATDHTNQFDIADLTFVFDNNAFINNPASGISNSGEGGAFGPSVGLDFIVAPGGVANSVFWLKAGAGVTTSGSEVTRWENQTGSGSNFGSQVFSGASEIGPALIASDANLNNNPSLDFTDNYLAIQNYDQFPSNSDFTFISVQRTNSGGADRTLIGYGADEWRIKEPEAITGEVEDGVQDFGSDADITGATTILTYKWNENGTSDGASIFINGKGDDQNPLADNKGIIDPNLDLVIGQDSDNDGTIDSNENFEGELAEVILFGSFLSDEEQQRIQSYLSMKYGIAMDQTIPVDYLASDGTTEMWNKDAPNASSFNHDIAGIGRDDDSGLGQVQSQSMSANNIVQITAEGEGTNVAPTFNDIADMEFLTWGHNDAAINSDGVTDIDNSTIEARIARTWLVQETGDVGAVTVSVDLSSITNITESDLRLLIDADGVFATGTTDHAGTLAGSVFTVTGVNFNDGDFFSIGSTDVDNTSLPITILSFAAKLINDQVLLEWATSSEISNDYFTIERSGDGLAFQVVAEIDGAGNSAEVINYNHWDKNPLAGVSYYRLKQTDFDGSFNYSKVIYVSGLGPSHKVITYPNPTRNNFFIEGGTEVSVFNTSGSILMTNKLIDGLNELDFSSLANGTYLLKIGKPTGETAVIRLIKE
ncbi:MAG: beta-propeller fold lactonase family protein [Cyclobacteriaceae bacterium]